MFNVQHIRNRRYSSSLLCFIIVCILVVCAVNEKPEFEKLSYSDSNNASSIKSPENEFYVIVSDETTSYQVIKSIVSKKPVAGKTIGPREQLTYAVIDGLFILVGICVFFLLHFFRELTTSHHFIITYIHNLDGMKP